MKLKKVLSIMAVSMLIATGVVVADVPLVQNTEVVEAAIPVDKKYVTVRIFYSSYTAANSAKDTYSYSKNGYTGTLKRYGIEVVQMGGYNLVYKGYVYNGL